MCQDVTFPSSSDCWEYEVMNMKKKMMLRGMAGIPIGITIGYLITVLISLGWGNGEYLPCVPELTVAVGNEIRSVILQTVL